MRKGDATRDRLLAIAEASVLSKGFGATSIEEVIAEAGITKSGFFYHFRDKNELARAMVIRYARTNDQIFADTFARADDLADGDPLQSFLIGLKMLAEIFSDLPNGHPGCLVAAVCYQERLFDREVRDLVADSVRSWNAFFEERLQRIADTYPANAELDVTELAQSICCVLDGAIIMSRVLADTTLIGRQLLLLRSHVKMLFQPAVAARRAA
ncbi:MAG TPA: TetR/AcrR family transcriptional regulator [Devosia sp.]|jgi:AcrR family transcriptional regulator|nr:TetR/AcrR family transcriptional regulator [Devosia sp.]